MSLLCKRCDGDGYLCTACEESPETCECADDFETDEPIEVRRCSCNPRRANTTKAPT